MKSDLSIAVVSCFLFLLTPNHPGMGGVACAEDGYEVWLRYPLVSDADLLVAYRSSITQVAVLGNTAPLESAGEELVRGLAGLLGRKIPLRPELSEDGAVIVGTASSETVAALVGRDRLAQAGPEGYVIRSAEVSGKRCVVIAGLSDRGALYGTFHFLRLLQTHQPIENLDLVESPACLLRLVNHWDNLEGSVERGYAGRSIFHWGELPKKRPRYKDYARMLASIGINGVVLNNVNSHKQKGGPFEGANSNKQVIATSHIGKVAALAEVFREYGIRTYVCPPFSSPVWLGGLETADPLDPDVRKWWREKADEIYASIPDFGGFLIKADSEGQRGPFAYGRDHAEGANMLAEALAPHGGLILWRAFVYGHQSTDRARQAYDNFYPLDGRFAKNVVIQIKNGPMDFQIREPVSPLFGRMPQTNLALELQITQEYAGYSTHLCYLVPQWKSYLSFDTFANGGGSTLGDIVAGTSHGVTQSGMAGVMNIGEDRNWTSHPLAQANTYGYGRLAWDPDLASERITEEWVKMTFGHDPEVVETVSSMLLDSWRIYENYTSPLGVGFMCGSSISHRNHYDPDPEKRQEKYHHADKTGVGYDRTQATGSGFTAQYHPPAARVFESAETCPDELLLFFHHVPYTHRLHSGKTVIQHIYDSHHDGVEQAKKLRDDWRKLQGKIDPERYSEVLKRLDGQIEHATLWRDTIHRYFRAISEIPDAWRERPK